MVKLIKVVKPPYGDGVDVMIGWCFEVESETETQYFGFLAGTFGAWIQKDSCEVIEVKANPLEISFSDRPNYFTS